MGRGVVIVWSAVAVLISILTGTGAAADPIVERGQYLVTIMDCGGCHTPGALEGKPDFSRPLAGSDIGFGGSAPMGAMTGGVVYPSNLTPDEETGLGAWKDEQVLHAIRHGARPDGRMLIPVMPWPSYNKLTDEDGRAIVAYLRSIQAVRHKVPANAAPGETPTSRYLKLVDGQ